MERAVLKRANEQKDPGMVRFVCISDTHSVTENLKIPHGDVLLHCGDFSKRGTPAQVQDFNSLLGSLPFQHKLVIAGNHDLTFDTAHFAQLRQHFTFDPDVESLPTKAMLTNCTYLEDSGTTVFGYRVWGTPWQPRYRDMGFNMDIGPELEGKWALIPNDTDILMTHSPPKRMLDKNFSGDVHCSKRG